VPVHIAIASRLHYTSAKWNFCHLRLVSNTQLYQAFKAKDDPQGQGQGLGLQGQGLTNFTDYWTYHFCQRMSSWTVVLAYAPMPNLACLFIYSVAKTQHFAP